MTAELAAYGPEDVQTAIVAWLSPVHPGRASFERKPGDAMPSVVVEVIPGSESPLQGYSDPLVSVHTFCDKSLGAPAARDACDKTHRRMLLLLDKPQITVGARTVGVDYLEVTESPSWQYFSDNILRKVGTYRVGLPYTRSA